ncbi:MAG TPA: TIR domain-containing protein [Pirellulales bacterium]|nr:TIR domain-containing protein [Pirellulales bacterium]
MAKPQQVFVIYGRNVAAYGELKKFLATVGAAEITFEDVANLQASPYVTEIVIKGIREAAAVIVLFTPDELAALYQTAAEAGLSSDAVTEARWQPRPNVLFEAGIAFAFKKEKTILVALGGAVAGFSDIGGIHLVRIDSPAGKQALRQRLQVVLKGLPTKLPGDWASARNSGDFARCVPKRWRFYDELSDLESFLAAQTVVQKKSDSEKDPGSREYDGTHTVFDVVTTIARMTRRGWQRAKPRDFMETVAKYFDDEATDLSYWWLVVGGFFQFQDIDHWWDDEDDWQESVDYTAFTPRGLALLEKIAR